MKKVLLILFSIFLLVGCETQEEREERKRKEEREKIKEELTEKEIPEEAKEWLISTKMNDVVTIFCLTTSKKCNTLKTTLDEIKKDNTFELFFINFDQIEDNVKDIYKNTFKLTDYTGYLPYIIITSKNKLVSTHTDSLDKEKLLEYFKENKIIIQEE